MRYLVAGLVTAATGAAIWAVTTAGAWTAIAMHFHG